MMGIIKTLFLWVLYSSISAGVVALIFILIRMLFKNRMAPRVFCMLWLFVIIKLIITPFAPGSLVSVFNIINPHPMGSYVQDTAATLQPFTYPSYPMSSDRNEQFPDQTGFTSHNSYDVPESANGGNVPKLDLVSVLALVWVAGLLLTAGIFVYAGIAFAKRLRKAERIPDALLPALIRDYKQKRRIKRSIEVYRLSGITNPCVIGLLKPRIILPQQVFELSDQQLTHILMHETAHLIRKDFLINILVAAVNAVHWFNPILWYAMKLFNMDREVSCDAYALEILGQEETIPYGMTLLQLSKMISKDGLQLNVSSFFKTEKQVRRRIIMIKKFKIGSYKISAAAFFLCLLIGMATLTNAAGANTTEAAQKDQIKAALGNKSYMHFNSIEKAQEFSDLTYKVPDYLPVGVEFYDVWLLRNEVEKSDLLIIHYGSAADGKTELAMPENSFSLSVSKGNLIQNVKSDKEATYEEEKTNQNGLDATYITVHTKQQMSDTDFVVIHTVKHLVWQDQNTWYDLECSFENQIIDQKKNKAPTVRKISQEDLNKIIASMKVPQNIKNIDYTSEVYKDIFAIYDERGLKDAEKSLGFTPKFPLCITGGFNISAAEVDIYPAIYTEYLSKATKDEASKKIRIEQSKLSSLYDSITKNGFVNSWNSTTRKNEPVLCKTVSIAGINVFAASDKKGKQYVWQQNGVYYNVKFSDGVNQTEDILKAFITLKP